MKKIELSTICLEALHSLCTYNLSNFKLMETYSCFYCKKTYSTLGKYKIVDDGTTVVCNKCGIDAVLPGQYKKTVLKQMYDHYF